MRVQQAQQRIHLHRLQRELEFDFRAAFAGRHVAQAHALRQRDGQGLPDQAGGQRDAVVQHVGGVAFVAQRSGDDCALVRRCGIAGLPVAPRIERRVLQRRVQGHAVAVAAEAQVDVGLRRSLRPRRRVRRCRRWPAGWRCWRYPRRCRHRPCASWLKLYTHQSCESRRATLRAGGIAASCSAGRRGSAAGVGLSSNLMPAAASASTSASIFANGVLSCAKKSPVAIHSACSARVRPT